ncbi:MAG: hypothetical protein ABEJ05_11760, partial [Haloglomus sp.]
EREGFVAGLLVVVREREGFERLHWSNSGTNDSSDRWNERRTGNVDLLLLVFLFARVEQPVLVEV